MVKVVVVWLALFLFPVAALANRQLECARGLYSQRSLSSAEFAGASLATADDSQEAEIRYPGGKIKRSLYVMPLGPKMRYIRLSPDASRAFTSNDNQGGIHVWNTDSGVRLGFIATNVGLSKVVISRRGRFVAVPHEDRIDVYNANSMDRILSLSVGQTGEVCGLAFHPDEKRLAVGTRKTETFRPKVAIFDIESGTSLVEFREGLNHDITHLNWILEKEREARYLVSRSAVGCEVRLFDAMPDTAGRYATSPKEGLGVGRCSVISPNGRLLLARALSDSREQSRSAGVLYGVGETEEWRLIDLITGRVLSSFPSLSELAGSNESVSIELLFNYREGSFAVLRTGNDVSAEGKFLVVDLIGQQIVGYVDRMEGFREYADSNRVSHENNKGATLTFAAVSSDGEYLLAAIAEGAAGVFDLQPALDEYLASK